MEFATIPIIVAICGIFMGVLKLFTNGHTREEEILSTLVPLFGAVLTLVLYLIDNKYMLEFSDPLVAIMIGFVSGQASLETKSTIDYLKSKKQIIEETTEIIKETQAEVITEVLKDHDLINGIVNTEEMKNAIEDTIKKTE